MDLLDKAVEHLKSGDIVAAPTDTVYGLFEDATNDNEKKKIYEVKGRPSYNPLIVHVNGIGMAKTIAEFNAEAENIANYSNGFINKFLYPKGEDNDFFSFVKDESIDLVQNICYWMYDNNFIV